MLTFSFTCYCYYIKVISKTELLKEGNGTRLNIEFHVNEKYFIYIITSSVGTPCLPHALHKILIFLLFLFKIKEIKFYSTIVILIVGLNVILNLTSLALLLNYYKLTGFKRNEHLRPISFMFVCLYC